MSFTEKIDVIELLLEVIKEHEQRIAEIAAMLERPKPALDMIQLYKEYISLDADIKYHEQRWSPDTKEKSDEELDEMRYRRRALKFVLKEYL